MPSTLVFPDGVRLCEREEIPGPETRRAEIWERVQQANISQGYKLQSTEDERYLFYAELNVDAPKIWAVFQDLCRALMKSDVTLLFGGIDLEPTEVGHANIFSVIGALSHYQYQLTHDGFLQFGILSEREGLISEVFVEPAKNFKVWLNDVSEFRRMMEVHGITETNELEFLDEYPRVTVRLPPEKEAFYDLDEMASRLKYEIAIKPEPN